MLRVLVLYMGYMSKKVFITGAAGFIGFHLARYLKKRGDEVVGFDNFNDYYSPVLKQQRAEILKKEGIELIEDDICNLANLCQTVRDFKTTHLVHLAAQAGVRYSLTNPHAYIKSNIEGFINILETCRLNPEVKLIYASSSSVYGLNKEVPFCETSQTDKQASFYGVTKKSNELMANTYHHLYGIPVVGLRFFTVYGPWGRPDMAYYTFAKKIAQGETIDLYNHGQMRRDFTYVDDIVKGTAAAIDHQSKCEIFNLGNNTSIELEKFITLLENSLEKKAKKRYVPMQSGDVLVTYANIDHSKNLLGYSPETPIEKGIPIFIEWFKNNQMY